MVQQWCAERGEGELALLLQRKRVESKQEQLMNIEISTLLGFGLYEFTFADNDELEMTRRKLVRYVSAGGVCLCVCVCACVCVRVCVCVFGECRNAVCSSPLTDEHPAESSDLCGPLQCLVFAFQSCCLDWRSWGTARMHTTTAHLE